MTGVWSVVGVKYIASVSFGKDSLAMLLRLLEENKPLDAVVFYDTGMEFDCIYNIRDRVKPLLENAGIEYVELHPQEPFLYSMLQRKIKYRNKNGFHYGYGWCGGPCRWGTSFKTRAIQEFKNGLNDDVIDYVGIAADETDRFEKAKSEGKRLPLVEWGMSEKDCLDYCHNKGVYWLERACGVGTEYMDLYDVLDRVSCWCCCNKNIKELRNIYRYLPQYWSRLKNLQVKIKAPFKRNSNTNILELEERFAFEDKWISDGKKIGTKEFFKALEEMKSGRCYSESGRKAEDRRSSTDTYQRPDAV